jgi:ADP-ribosyl-[dinitrogen reductase] hydrolase
MRLSPVPIFYQEQPETAEAVSISQGRLTHDHAVPCDACMLLCRVLIKALQTGDKALALDAIKSSVVDEKLVHIQQQAFLTKDRDEIQSDGYVVSTLEAALWAVGQTDNFGMLCYWQ